ncbi:MauE/DoxX family redox-associated membrane protein [Gephyromycinifex aptenodytis]|uniref:MauE/DoxX family redox-associated membrane protein n=1 Tax=Gephyromycinifex aptenodytis TaxID=2716227 RepID=UPI001446694D|nr:MauE/DoxX family redox-associated membrane protein [Gephyromycinifex aptenodytis]
MTPWVGLVARLILGAALLVAGGMKIGSPLVAARAAQAYQILPFDLAGYVGMALPAIEMALGLLLVLGLYTRFAAGAGAVLMLVFVAAIASAWARGLSIDCGCFGGGGAVAPEQTQYGLDIARDFLLALCGGWLLARPHTSLSLDAVLSERVGA